MMFPKQKIRYGWTSKKVKIRSSYDIAERMLKLLKSRKGKYDTAEYDSVTSGKDGMSSKNMRL